MRARIAVAGNNDIIVKVPNIGRGESLVIGAEVGLGWKPSDCRALNEITSCEKTIQISA